MLTCLFESENNSMELYGVYIFEFNAQCPTPYFLFYLLFYFILFFKCLYGLEGGEVFVSNLV